MIEEKFGNKFVAELLRNIAAAYKLRPEDEKGVRFKIIAYEKAADTIEHLSRELKDIWQDGKLYKIPGVGSGIGSALEEYFEKGESHHFNEVLKNIPPSVFLLMKVPGIGPKKAFRLVMQFGINDKKTAINDLRNIAKIGQIAHLEGFGEKSQDDIIQALDIYDRRDRREERMPLSYAMEVAYHVIEYLNKLGSKIKRIDVMGSLRRRVATIGDIDIAVAIDEIIEGSDPQSAHMRVRPSQAIIDHFLKYPGKRSVEGAGHSKASILVVGNIRIDLRVQTEDSYGSMLQYFTGSKAHNIKLREHALKKGYSLSEYGLKRVKSLELGVENEQAVESLITFKDEESLYSFLGLQYVPPELRENTGEIEKASNKSLPVLVDLSDITGDLHTHSSYDIQTSHDQGKNTYKEICKEAVKRRYQYIGFSDHNPKQSGLLNEDIMTIMKKRRLYIDQILSSSKIPYFIGLEVDILPSGKIALPEKAITYVDYLIVSIHSSFRMEISQMTERVLKALSHPKVRIFGHPIGRLIGKREGVNLDWTRIFEYCKNHNIALEINSAPIRLDLPDALVHEGKKLGVKFVINTDAHEIGQMANIKYGVSVARRGWLEKKDVINTWQIDEVEKWLKD